MKLLLLLIVSCTNLSNLDKAYDRKWDGIIAMREGKDESLTILLETYGKAGCFAPGTGDYPRRSMIGAIVDEFTKEDKQEAEQKIIAAVKDYIQYDKLNTDAEGLDTIHRIIRKGYRDLFELYLQEKLDKVKSAARYCEYKYIYTAIEVEDEYFIKKVIDISNHINIESRARLSELKYSLIRSKEGAIQILLDRGATIKNNYDDMYYLLMSKVSKEIKRKIIESMLTCEKYDQDFYTLSYRINLIGKDASQSIKEDVKRLNDHYKTYSNINIDFNDYINNSGWETIEEQKLILQSIIEELTNERKKLLQSIEEEKRKLQKDLEVVSSKPLNRRQKMRIGIKKIKDTLIK